MKWPQTLAVMCLPLVLLVVGSSRTLRAQDTEEPTTDEVVTARGRVHPIESLAWMEGAWQGSGLGGSVEEHWSGPAGSSMTGMFRLVQREATSFTQFMLIEAEEGGRVVLRFQHYTPGFEPWEKSGPLLFELIEADAAHAVFQSPDPKQVPARLSYAARGRDALSVVIESPEALGGPISFEVLLKRAERP